MAMLSPVDLYTGDGFQVRIDFKRYVTNFVELSQLILHLESLDREYVDIMSSHPEPEFRSLVVPARIDEIFTNSPIEITIDVHLAFVGTSLLILKVLKEYPEYRESLPMIAADLKTALSKVEGIPRALVEPIRDRVCEALEAKYQYAQDKWPEIRKRAGVIREFFSSEFGIDIDFTCEEMAS